MGISHIKPCFSRNVGCRFASKPTNLSLLWWLSMFLVRSCCWSEWWFCPSVIPDVGTTKIWTQITAHFSFFSWNLLSRGIPVWNDVMNGWFFTSWGHRCFQSLRRSFRMDTEFSRFLEIICNVPFQMMKLLILDSWRLSNEFHEFGCWISGHGESPWQELFFDGNKSFQTLPLKKSWVSPCIKTNQSQPSLMALNVFGTQLLLVGVMILSIRNSWCWYQQNLNTNCSSFQFLFLKIAESQNSSLK